MSKGKQFSVSVRAGWKLYVWAFGYVRSSLRYMGVAVILSLVLSVISGVATYSFLPIFSLVFEGGNTLSSAVPKDVVAGGGVSSLQKAWSTQVTVIANDLLKTISGEGSVLNRLWRLLIFITGMTVISSGLALLVDYIFIRVQADGIRRLREAVFRHMCSLPIRYYDKERAGVLLSRVLIDIGGAVSAVAKSVSDIILHSFLAIVFLWLLLLINLQLVLLLFPILLVIGVFAMFTGRWIKRTRKRILELQADILSWLQEFLSGIRIVRSSTAEKFEQGRWSRLVRRGVRLEVLGNLNKALPLRLTEVFVVVLSAIVMSTGGWLISEGRLSIPEFLIFFVVLLRFQRPATGLVRVWWNVQNGLAFADRVYKFMDEPLENDSGKKSVSGMKESIEFSNLSFRYDDDLVLRNVSFVLPYRKVVALVGPSGAGKSSIVDLLLRFYDPTDGQIFLDGVNINKFRLHDYRSLFGVVSQETYLFHDTIRNNIGYALPEGESQASIESAARAAHAHDFISKFPEGYDTVVGDRGVRLSGGQRQRIALARAIIRDPVILVLDEATSALDSESERQVQAAVEELARERTTLVIAHRLSTVRGANEILVINEGKLVESGSHDTLVGHDGLYKHLWELQTQGSIKAV